MMVFIFLCAFHVSVFAVTEQDITDSVLKNFPLIEQASMKFEATAGEVTEARGNFDHKLKFKSRNKIEDKYDNQYFETILHKQTPYKGLELFAGHRQGTGTFAPYDGKYATSSAGEIFAGLALPLLRSFQTDEARLAYDLSQLRKNLAEAELELKKNIYLHKGLSLYYKWLYTNQKLQIRESVLKIAEERQKMLEKKFAAGDIEKLKLTDNLRSIMKRNDELEKARIEWQQTRTLLELYYRDEKGKSIILGRDVFPTPDIRRVARFNENPEILPQLRIIESEVKMKMSEIKFAEQSRLPGLQVELLGAKELSPNQPYDPDRIQVGVSFDLPLENRKAEGKTVSSEYEYRALLKEKEYFLQSMRQQLTYANDAIEMTQKRWELTTNEFETTKSLARAERIKWNQGASDLYIVTLREQDAAEAEIKRWDVWYEYHQYLLDAKLYSGNLVTRMITSNFFINFDTVLLSSLK